MIRYAYEWQNKSISPGMSIKGTRAAESRQLSGLGEENYIPVISPGAPEADMYDSLAPVSGFVDTVKANPILLIGGAALVYMLFFHKKKSSGLVGRTIAIRSIAAR
jgi:hypothetical protein